MEFDVGRMARMRAIAVAAHDWSVVREIEAYAASRGITLDLVADPVFETAEPPQLEHAVVPVRRGPGRPRNR